MICRKTWAILLALAVAAAVPAFSQETGDEMFQGDILEEEGTAAPAANPVVQALKGEALRIGGVFSGTLGAGATWNDPWKSFSPLSPDSTELDVSLKSTLFFDARPAEDFRVYGSAKAAWPFVNAAAVSAPGGGSVVLSVPTVKVFELFSDFSYNDRLYFRFGKSTVKWGVGYFWSPADVVNLQPIDILDPTAQREGPVNFRVQVPVPNTQNNVYAYAIIDEGSPSFETTALAARAEFLAGNWEIGCGAYYRHDTAERVMATVTGPVGNFDIFGEAMLSRGSAKTFVTGIQPVPPYAISLSGRQDHRGEFYFSASAGFVLASPRDYFTAVGQYFFNGEGYGRAKREELVSDAMAAIAGLGSGAEAAMMRQALAGLVYGSGMHYAAVSLAKDKFPTEKTSLSLVAIANLSDGSGFIRPSIAWEPIDRLKVSLSPTFFFGSAASEYYLLAGGSAASVSLSASLGGSF